MLAIRVWLREWSWLHVWCAANVVTVNDVLDGHKLLEIAALLLPDTPSEWLLPD
jgi:hypothetical protein